ncbi:MAG: hypothetical protein L6Q81_14420 [Bacteroidia bacterium]|nr:hypothetical protein [Bacteroidia bacterium]
MKFPFKLMLAGFLLTLSLISFSSFTRSNESTIINATTVEELLIQVPKSNAKNQLSIESAIIATKGVEYKGYCSSLQVYMMLVDRSVQSNDLFIEQIMKNEGLDFYVKEGATIAAVKTTCGMDENTAPQNSQQ